MDIKIKKKDIKLEYTFNSFSYMEDFDVTALDEVETKPFKMIPLVILLLLGAVNCNPKVVVTEEEVREYISEYIKTNSISTLLEELVTLLQDSDFFKSLQMKN